MTKKNIDFHIYLNYKLDKFQYISFEIRRLSLYKSILYY